MKYLGMTRIKECPKVKIEFELSIQDMTLLAAEDPSAAIRFVEFLSESLKLVRADLAKPEMQPELTLETLEELYGDLFGKGLQSSAPMHLSHVPGTRTANALQQMQQQALQNQKRAYQHLINHLNTRFKKPKP